MDAACYKALELSDGLMTRKIDHIETPLNRKFCSLDERPFSHSPFAFLTLGFKEYVAHPSNENALSPWNLASVLSRVA